MNNYPPSPYSGQNPPYSGPLQAQPGYPQTRPAPPYAQPNAPFPPPPPGFLQPGAPPPVRKKKRLLVWISLLVLLLLAVGAGSYFYFQLRSTPQKTLQAYCDAMKNNDAQALYNTLTPELQSHTSVSKLQQGLRLLDFLTGGFQSCTLNEGSLQENGSSATANVTLVPNRGAATTPTIRLKEENGQWRIQDNASIPG